MKPFLLVLLVTALCRTILAAENQQIVFHDVTVIDGTGAASKPHMTVVISGNRIVEVAPAAETTIPARARVIDASGRFLIPGLWDMHVHLSKSGENTLPLFIANGVTSVRDMGGDVDQLLRWKSEIEEGKRVGPRIKMAGPMLETAAKIEQMRRDRGVEPFERLRIGIAGPDEAEAVVDRLAQKRVDFLKIRSVASVETYRAISAAAQKRGLTLVGHPVTTADEILRARQRSIEHGFYPSLDDRAAEQRRELFRGFSSNGMAMVPTFIVGEVMLNPYAKMKRIAKDQEGRVEPKRKYLSGYLIEDWKEQVEELKDPWPGLEDFLSKRLRDVGEMFGEGVRIMPGTDTAVLLIWPGFSLHDELRLFIERLGMTPMQAIVSATRSPAEFFGLQESLGTIEKGKFADLVLLQADPLKDIANTTQIATVVRHGRLFTAADIQKLLKTVETAARQ